jgi:hypothetical protein
MTMLKEREINALIDAERKLSKGRPQKFTPDNIQKIKNWVAEGISRERIAKSLDVTVGSLQVTCSRRGISLRTPKMFERRRAVVSRPYISNHPPMMGHVGPKPQHPRFQVVLERNGSVQCVTEVPFKGLDIVRLGLEAAGQNLGMGQLLTQAVITAIKKNMIQEILGGGGHVRPSLERPSTRDSRESHPALGHT